MNPSTGQDMAHDGGKREAAKELLASAPEFVEWANNNRGLWRDVIVFFVLLSGITLWFNANYHFPPIPF